MTLREAIVATGAHGDPVAVPWLIERMSAPAVARVAAEAVALITGADLESAALKAAGPGECTPGAEETDDDEEAADPVAEREDGNLPHPDPAGFHTWWRANAERFSPGHALRRRPPGRIAVGLPERLALRRAAPAQSRGV